MTCPHCHLPIPAALLRSEAARALGSHKNHVAGTGRPRSTAERCPCQKMTAKRAAARKHVCEATEARGEER